MTKPGLLAWLNTPRGGVVMLIATTFLARLLFADWLGLGVDESYVVAAGRTLHLGYFDHPPLVWWLAWAGGHLPGQARDLLVRIPFILLFGVSTWLMFRLASELYDECAGLWSAAALNAAPVLGLTAGTWVLPDGPLIAALLGAALCLVRALSPSGIGWAWWLGTGLCFGFAALSKYTAAPVGIGVALYLLTQPQARHWLFRPQPYVAACLAAAMFVPVVVWNQQHGWASFRFQGGRADGGHWHPLGPFFTLAGEAIFLLPWLGGLLVICLWQAARRGPAEPRGWLLICLSLPTILLFELVSLRGHVLFHWAAPGTMLGLPLVGEVIGRLRARRRAIRVGLVATACFVTLGVLLVGTEVRFNWLP
jgi:4-amino-4-deoxy-L-arabinose transferase-like glycosyltransferase